MSNDDVESAGPCVFCGKPVAIAEGPISVTFETDDAWQVFLAHRSCVGVGTHRGDGIELTICR